MTRAPVLFRVDATPRAGYEQLQRCLTLAAALQRRRRPTYFLSLLEPGYLGLNLKRSGNDWLQAGELAGTDDDLDETLQEIRRLRPAAVIVDVPEVRQDYLQALASTGVLLANLDNQATIPFISNLLINPLLGPDKEAYEFSDETQILMGARFALVRPEIRRIRAVRTQEPPPLPAPSGKNSQGLYRVLVALGEDDPNQQTLSLVKQMLNTPRIGRVDAVVRSHHPDIEQLRTLAAEQPERLEIAVEPTEVTARIVRCHFAITSGSGWALELACVGVPQLVIVQSEAYWPTAQRLEDEGCVTCLGWHANVSPATIRGGVQDLLADSLERQAMSRCGRKLVDGRGPDRLVNALEIMLHGPALAGLRDAA